MSLTTEQRRVTKVLGIISDATPEFISLVPHAATQKPWTHLKADVNPPNTPMSLRISKSAANVSAAAIHKFIVTKCDAFPDEATVKSFLEGHNFRGVKIEKSEDGNHFVVPGQPESAFTKVASMNFTEDGNVKLFVGTPVEPTQKTADVDPASVQLVAQKGEPPAAAPAHPKRSLAKEAGITDAPAGALATTPILKHEKLVKFDSYLSYYTNSQSIAGILSDCNDGLPVGFWDIEYAFRKALTNVLSSGNSASVATLTAEYGAILTRLADISVLTITKGEDGALASIEKFMTTKSEQTPAPETPVTPPIIPVAGAETPVVTPEPTATPAVPPVQKGEATPAATDMASIMKAALAEVLTPITAKLESIEKATTATTERVDGLEKARQTSKGADVEDAPTTLAKADHSSEPPKLNRLQRAQFGRSN